MACESDQRCVEAWHGAPSYLWPRQRTTLRPWLPPWLDAVEQAADVLASERDNAVADAAKAAEIVHIKANAVMDCIAIQLVSELIAARDVLWKLEEKASGFFLLDEHRQTPKFATLKEEVRRSLNRQAADRERNPEYIEFGKWASHIDRVNQDAWGRWKAFGRELEHNADAVFDSLDSEPQH